MRDGSLRKVTSGDSESSGRGRGWRYGEARVKLGECLWHKSSEGRIEKAPNHASAPKTPRGGLSSDSP